MQSDELDFYNALADVYFAGWGAAYLETARQQFSAYLQPQLKPGASILDVCCGTGQLAAALTAEGYRVTGVDLSPEMIERARTVAPDARFTVGEMSEFVLGVRFDAAVCCFNSLNHARGPRHLARTLTTVRRHLEPGGRFLADLVMEEGYAHSWTRQATVDTEHGECQLRFVYEPRRQRAYCDATLRVEGAEPKSVRMRQHVFSQKEIYEACAQAELKVEGLYPVPGDPPVGRVALVAQRR